jgi:hypothetical protein
VGAAAYGSVLVLAALSAISVSEVAQGHGAELVAGVGLATWIAHLFAELLAEHVRHDEPLDPLEIRRAAADGSPILASTAVPAIVLLLGRLDMVDEDLARTLAIVAAIGQLVVIGALVARVAPYTPAVGWMFGVLTGVVGLTVVVLTVALGH